PPYTTLSRSGLIRLGEGNAAIQDCRQAAGAHLDPVGRYRQIHATVVPETRVRRHVAVIGGFDEDVQIDRPPVSRHLVADDTADFDAAIVDAGPHAQRTQR